MRMKEWEYEIQQTEKKTTDKLRKTETKTGFYIWSDIPYNHTKNEGYINTDWMLTKRPSVSSTPTILCHHITICLWYAEGHGSAEKATESSSP